MNPKDEACELLTRSRRLLDAALLLVITAALLVVAAGILFCTSWITVFTMARNTIDRATAKVSVERGAAFHVVL